MTKGQEEHASQQPVVPVVPICKTRGVQNDCGPEPEHIPTSRHRTPSPDDTDDCEPCPLVPATDHSFATETGLGHPSPTCESGRLDTNATESSGHEL